MPDAPPNAPAAGGGADLRGFRVARLAAQALSNRDIARALFITTKTVSDHLSSTYRKLNINTRDHSPQPWQHMRSPEVLDSSGENLSRDPHEGAPLHFIDAPGAELCSEQLKGDLFGVATAGVLSAHTGRFDEHRLVVIHRSVR